MKIFTVDLYKYFDITREENAVGYLTCYVNENTNEISYSRKHPAMIVIPGGGYGMRSDRENEPIALQYLANDYCAFTLQYAITPAKFPTMLIESCMAVAYVRENANELNVNENAIACVGFSAGGHLCAMTGTMFNDPAVTKVLGEKSKLTRPDAVVLGYPVITGKEGIAHRGSFINLCGNDAELTNYLSVENRVTKDSAPAFIFHTSTDGVVPVQNSLIIANAYVDAGVPFALHVFEKGEHGLSLADLSVYSIERFTGKVFSADVAKWVDLSITWLKERGFTVVE